MISDAQFAQTAIRAFTRQDQQISDLQTRLSSGVNDPRVSADPARAMELSALRDLRSDLSTQTDIGRIAADRLAMTDSVLSEVSDGVRELYRISLQANNDTLTREAHGALRVQAETLRNTLLAAANATDPQGRPLFSGNAPGPAFVNAPDGVRYQGDNSATAIQMGRNTLMQTGLPGGQVFGDGQDSVFALLDDVITGLSDPVLGARDTVRANQQATLQLGIQDDPITFDIAGPEGRTLVQLPLSAGSEAAQIAAINSVSAQTGVQAQAAPDGVGIRLSAAGDMTLSNQTSPMGNLASRPLVTLQQLDSDGTTTSDPVALRPAHLERQELLARSSAKVGHMAEMHAAVGALGSTLDSRLEQIAETRLTVDQAMSRLNDVNVAETITRLQTLLLTQQASQQSFVKIAGQSLFDYLR
ncbi:MAG: flagellar hook-associated protein 3 [Roseibaca calidilacus]|uniref:Flagellar hook-associated protein 3 n=1 Tax=Roseibaca calidilacus TaxID=1666912 RepID=A0A0N8K8V4_9RHOB|nr:flagellar hook-associated protein FlgL [Roseibaca calidilacus]KPP95585.1 MAG: flagellar hook-associated protein 3 [Roseibaca calidilacus]CUX82049.1 flagellar hook-associated protein 3 FlgL [Roseibaca calidilacus]